MSSRNRHYCCLLLFIVFCSIHSVAGNGNYKREELYRDEFEVMYKITWPPQSCSSIHSHGGRECSLVLIQGELHEELYRFPFADKLLYRTILSSDPEAAPTSSYIRDEIGMHRICNPSTLESAQSIHIYRPPFNFTDIIAIC